METSPTTPAKVAKPAKTAVSNLTLGNADDALSLATELQKFVKANGLTSNIQGKAFPQVEAWMFAGSLLGLSTLLESIEDRSTADEIKWQAMVSIINTRTGAIVGRGFATCSNKEHSKRAFADYAICSMAQTRAVGKAYRLSLGWLMKAAGYEATPAEEMQDAGTSAAVVASPAMGGEYEAALQELSDGSSIMAVWNRYPELHGYAPFKNRLAAVKAERAGITNTPTE